MVTGEDPADYEAYHDQFLAELAPVGAVEAMLTERVVSLALRLRRAEHIQNQCIQDFIERKITNPLPRRTRVLMCNAQGIPLGDHRCISSHLPLGRIATIDWSNNRVLDWMLIYERRIELSMYKTLDKLKTYQIMRRIEYQDALEQQFAQAAPKRGTGLQPVENMAKMAMPPAQAIPKACGFEAATQTVSPQTCSGGLKKQSQFVPALMGATSYVKGDYGSMSVGGIEENKANSKPNKANQSQLHASVLTKLAGKRKKSVAATTG